MPGRRSLRHEEFEEVHMRVLVTGDRGYIGAVMAPFLMAAGHEVVGLDAGWYDGCDFGTPPDGYEQRTGVIRLDI
jgi:NAD dependent epimerase/dehydratase family